MTADGWLETVEALWPGARVDVVSPGTRGAQATQREFAFLPDADRPRLLLPGSPRAAATALRRYSHDLTIPQRVSRSLTATAMRTGLPQRTLRDRLRVVEDGEGGSIEDRLGGLLGEAVVVSVGLGTARANRKPILHVLSPSGRPLAFVKVGDTETARDLITQEAAALEFLAGVPLERVAVPRVLHHGPWNGMTLLVLSPLPTSARGWRPRRNVPIEAMREVFAAAGVTSGPLADSGFLARLREVPSRVSDPEQAGRLDAVIERVGRAYGGQTLRFGAWHGDWTPWNMAWHRGKVQLWDWERFARDVPAGLDLLHCRLQEAMRSAGEQPYTSWPAGSVRTLTEVGVTGRDAAATLELYFVELCCRYLLAAQGPIGAPLRTQAERLLTLLQMNAGRSS
ncbi:phosphotransferase [Actinomadura sp. HBU206391]|uniref:phosphotransferase n=1 Tax=Actinomadura sp. HBU206391 TaxID=2731692 RepID=UPI00164F01D6|nr:phosphotransferase [Actinomadura sp. HBU206391]MBC6459065.1 phosphotransferase [Actinomadura sp. HBU206391]